MLFIAGISLSAFLQTRGEGVSVSALPAAQARLLKGNNSPSKIISSAQLPEGELINICTASSDELCRLPGIGNALSAAIIEYREANGPFLSTEDIMKVPGIGLSRYNAISEYICVN